MSTDLTKAREALAHYDIPRCTNTLTVERPNGPATYQCCLPAGHKDVYQFACDYAPRFTGVHVDHLRAALGRVDELEREVAEAWLNSFRPSLPAVQAGCQHFRTMQSVVGDSPALMRIQSTCVDCGAVIL